MAKPADTRTAGSKRQGDYVDRLKEKGYVILSSVYVPAAIRDACRALVKAHVAKFEKEQTKF